MFNVLSNLIGALFMILISIYIWKTLLNRKIKFNDYRLYCVILVSLPIILLNFFYTNSFFKISIITLILIFCNKFLFNTNMNEAIVSSIFGQFIINFSDIFFALILVFIFGMDNIYISENILGTLLPNTAVTIISFVIINLKITKRLYVKIVEITYKFNIISLTKIGLFLIMSISTMMFFIYYKSGYIYNIVFNVILLIIYSYIVYKSLYERNNSITIKEQNDALMDNLNEYENMLDRQRITNHENKNQLLIIQNMIKNKDKNVVAYIDAIIKDEKEDDEILYTKVKKIPSGGLQGIIYQKMLVMKDKNINFTIDVGRDVRKIDLDCLGMDDNYKLCKIVGVLLDNAIEESINIDDKNIMISLYDEDGMLVIDISNKFGGNINLESIDKKGYTTKGDGHGYGLCMVKDLVNESSRFINEREIRGNIFKQIIRVKVK